MKLTIFVLFGCALCWGGVAVDCTPSSLNIPGAPYPCVHPDRRVTFRVAAPDAQKVQVRLGGTHDMTRGEDGLWMVTIPPQVIGFHYYSIVVDGSVVADPATRRSSARDGTTAGSRSRTPTLNTTRRPTFRTGKCASAGTTQRSRANGGGLMYTRRRTTRPTCETATRFSFCCMDGARMSRAGTRRATRIFSWTTSSPRRKPSR